MRDTCSRSTGWRRGRAGAHVCDVWRNEDPCAATFKQRFPQQPHAPLVPLSRLRDEAPPLPLGLMQPHAYARAHVRTHTHTHICKGISTFDLRRFCANGTSVHQGCCASLLIYRLDRGEALDDTVKCVIRYTLMSNGVKCTCGEAHGWGPRSTLPTWLLIAATVADGTCCKAQKMSALKLLNVIWIQLCLLWNVCN